MNGFEQWIATLGFPIAVVIYLFYERSTLTKEFTKALSNNTKALIELKTLIRERLKE